MARVTKEMTMGELLQTYYEQCPEIVDVLTGLGMHCIGCPSSIGESLADAAYVHGIDSDLLVEKLNAENRTIKSGLQLESAFYCQA